MAELFAVSKPNISMLIAKIFAEKELDDSVVKSHLTTAADGKRYNVIYYALEIKKRSQFPQKGTRRLTTFGARRKRGLQTRRTWRSCDESRTKPSGVAGTRRTIMNAEELEKIVTRHEMHCLELMEVLILFGRARKASSAFGSLLGQ